MSIKNWKVTTDNRSAAKRLLNTWHDSRQVRTMTLAQLTLKLDHAVRDGLMTNAGIERALQQRTSRQLRDSDAKCHDDANSESHSSKYDSDWCDEKNEREQDSYSTESNDDTKSDRDENAKSAQDESDNARDDDESKLDDNDDSQSDDESSADDSADESNDSDADSDNDGKSESDDESDGDDDESNSDESDEESESESDDECSEQRDESNDLDKCDDCGKPYPQNDLSVRADGLAVCPDCYWSNDEEIFHEMYEVVCKYVDAGLNVAFVGPAGSGKSYLARQVAANKEKEFFVNGAMMSKYDLIGFNDAHGEYHDTPAHNAFVKGGLHCFDELDASAPEAVVAFNGITDDQPFYTFPNGQQNQHEDYVAIACMNT
jgi:hypothetical protein